MHRAWFSLITILMGSVSLAQAQSSLKTPSLELPLSTLQLTYPKIAPAVEIGGAVEGTLIDQEEGPRKQRDQWFLGAMWRHIWVPALFEDIFADVAPSVSTGMLDFIEDSIDPNLGILATYRNRNGFSIIFGLGYTSYEFEGAYRSNDDSRGNTEWVESDLWLLNATGALLWSSQLGDAFAFEYGIGMDIGLVFGDITRTEAVLPAGRNSEWEPCVSAGVPSTPINPNNPGQIYCEPPSDPNTTTDPSSEQGAHYNVKVGRWSDNGDIPNVIPIPMIPQIALRFSPVEEFVIKLEAAYGIMEFWAGVSIHGALWTAEKEPSASPELRVVERPELVVTPIKGRVNGLVVEQGTEVPVPNAKVTVSGHPDIQPVETLADGRFTTQEFDPGTILFEIEHPEYESSNCEVTIPEKGGEIEHRCSLIALSRVGKIDGRVLGPSGPLPGVKVELTGPMMQVLTTDDWGAFKIDNAKPGNYLAHVSKDGFMEKTKEFTVVVRETAKPEFTLVEKPKLTMVKVEKKEIKIERKIHFATGSATIKASSFPLMNEIASVFKSYSDIKLVEIQGHTDSRGSDKYNLKLSQKRADSVRNWLVSAGIEPERMTAKGYGESLPIESNRRKSGRAANRRVQFIILERDEEPR